MTHTEHKSNPVLNFFSLSDEYERRARFLPAMLTVLVVLPVALAFGIEMMQFLTLLMKGGRHWRRSCCGYFAHGIRYGKSFAEKNMARVAIRCPDQPMARPN